MLSKEMYSLLVKVPRNQQTVEYSALIENDDKTTYLLVSEALNDCGFLKKHGEFIKSSAYSLTEKGKAAVEEHEQTLHNQEVMKTSLSVARIAMLAAVFSAIAAVVSLVKMFL